MIPSRGGGATGEGKVWEMRRQREREREKKGGHKGGGEGEGEEDGTRQRVKGTEAEDIENLVSAKCIRDAKAGEPMLSVLNEIPKPHKRIRFRIRKDSPQISTQIYHRAIKSVQCLKL